MTGAISGRRLRTAERITVGTQRTVVPCIGRGNIWIDEDFTTKSLHLAQEVIARALEGTDPGQLEIAVFDYNLRGIAAPFASLQDVHLLKAIFAEDELKKYFVELKRHIQGVRNVIRGREDGLIEFRSMVGRPIESFKLIVITADLYLLSDEVKEALSIMLAAGPGAGVTFLIVSPADEQFDFLRSRCRVLEARTTAPALRAVDAMGFCDRLLVDLERSSLDPVLFESIEDLDRLWSRESTDGLTFAVGRYGLETVEITMGGNRDQLHNALITGAVGQGKSNLIAVILHSLCQRYSPRELELYLLDFKEGVTLQAYAGINHPDYLPHARALGLDADVDYGIAVLEHLYDVYEDRMALFKRSGVQNIKQYRERTGEVVPRILAVIDEFQMMFEDRETARFVVALLSKCTRLFRAAGIHFILASQTIASGVVLDKDSDIFAQTPIRMAHRNSERESQATLGMGNTAAAGLHTGEAIVNCDYGALASNRKVQVAWANDALLANLRRMWWERSRSYAPAPCVFEGTRRITMDGFARELRSLRGGRPTLCLGKAISVEGEMIAVDFAEEAGRNFAVLGAGDDRKERESPCMNVAVGVLQAAVLSLALGNTLGDAEFVFCDMVDSETSRLNGIDRTAALVEQLGFAVERLDVDAFCKRSIELYGGLASRAAQDDKVYLVCFAIDRICPAPPEFSRLAKEGPAKGVHFLCWWQKAGMLDARESMGLDGPMSFDVKVLLRAGQADARHLMGVGTKWEPRSNRALVADSVSFSEPMAFIPFSPMEVTAGSRLVSAVCG